MKNTSPPALHQAVRLVAPNILLTMTLVMVGALLFVPAPALADEDVSRQAFVAELDLAHNSPNPFNANTTISYSLLADAHVRLDIFDLRGRFVATLLDEDQFAGDNFAIWKTETAPSGTYFFCFSVEDIRVFGKMSLV